MKTNTENRTVFHTVRFTPGEGAQLVEHASACGLSVSALLRARALGRPSPKGVAPAINLAAWRELASTTANLNQLSHHLNVAAISAQPFPIDLEEVKLVVATLSEQVKALRLELLGASS